ncbi:hypothetical protein [Streptomyces sp. NBC_01268]|uniref:hypothetical protein n=1 Tax=Streptomyces sp. NBC_01268 TaxID=2903806 RepID=UPI002E30221E|nr:hypothetical protein [Streptomyces sp. NBC_01268]
MPDSPYASSDVPPQQALLAVDMQGYSRLPEAMMAPVRSDLDDVLTTVLAHSGIADPRSVPGTFKDTGDGAILVLPAKDTGRLIDPLLGHLHAALVRYDRERLPDGPSIRLRAAVHIGSLSLPDHRGDAINEVCRLLDSGAVRQALAAAGEHEGGFLAAIVSEPAYRCTVGAGRTAEPSERHFLPAVARVEGKPGFEERCRLYVPGLTPYLLSLAMSAKATEATEETGGTADVCATAPADAPPHTPSGGSSSVFQINGAMSDPTLINHVDHMRIDRRGI